MIVSELSERIKEHGFNRFGFAELKRPLSLEVYRQWLEAGCHADMDYLARHFPMKENPQLLSQRAQSAIVIGEPYYPPNATAPKLRTALYAQSSDYHHWFQAKLEKLAETLRQVFSAEEFLCCTDNKPVLERELGVRAGLGWIGKNGCLLDRKAGSLFLIGEILTSLHLSDSGPLPDHCGTCDRCVRACPTAAIRGDRTLDARLCIAYWTIESKGVPPPPLRAAIGDWFFGCDLCQTVCPWNEKVFGKTAMKQLTVGRDADIETDLRWCLSASQRQLKATFAGSPIWRAGPRGIRRNALIVTSNLRLLELRPEVEQVAKRHPQLRELVDWTLSRLV